MNSAQIVKGLQHQVSYIDKKIKGTVNVSSSDPPCKDCNARFTTVALKP